MSDKTVVYDGTRQSVEAFSNPAGLSFTYTYEGTLSDGTSYGPLPTPPTDAGTYTVTASFVGNGEYVAGSVQARLTIEKAPVTIYVGSQTVIRGGTIREEATVIDIKGKVVSPGTISYAYKGIGATPYPGPDQPTNTATGTYQVTVAFAGDKNYLPATGTGILTILPPSSPYPGIYLRDTVVVFGHSYTMEAVTEPATGLSPKTKYTYSGTRWDGTAHTALANAPDKAGRYTVKAVSGTGGGYTQSSTTTANLIIQKAPQTIDMPQAQFDGKSELNIGDVIAVSATVSSPAPTSSSDFSVTLTSSDPSVASFGSGPDILNLTILSTGSTLIKAEVADGNNYEAAVPVYRLLYVKKRKTPSISVTTPQETTYTGENLYITPGTTNSDTILEYKYINRAAPADTLTAAKDAGEYDVLVISPSIGDFAEDSIKVPFTVKKDSIILELTAKNTGYTGSPIAIDPPVIRGGTAATDLAGTLQIQYDGNPTPPAAPGFYTVTATIDGDNNHIGTTATTTLTITERGASLLMSDKSVVYDGTRQSVEAFSNPAGLSFTYTYEGTLLDGTSYGPSTTPPIDAGTYTVTASFAGNGEYVNDSVQARLTIEKAPVTVYVGSQTVRNSKPIREEATVIDIKGKVVSGIVSYTYKGIGDTNYPGPAQPANNASGTYQVTVAFAGDKNYLPATGTGILTILPSGSKQPGIYLRDTVVVFGHPYTMEAVTEPATGLSPTTYTYSGTSWDGTAYMAFSTAPDKAGRYTVKAVSGTGGGYTQSSTTTANLIIQKAPQTIDMPQAQFDGKNELNIGDVIAVSATVLSPNSSSPVTLTSSDPLVASFGSGPDMMKLTIHLAGGTLIKAEVAGNTNYEAAVPVYRLLYVKGGKVTIENPLHVNGCSGPSESMLCDVNTYDLSLTAKGSILDYIWYRNGQQIATTTDSICTITEAGTYTVDVNGVLDTVSSGPVTVRFSSSPVITKDLQDAAIVGGHVTLTVEATGPGLEYEWYFNNQIITGANTESLTVREEGAYYVQVSNKCGRVLSSTARVTDQIVDPIIKRRIDLPQVEGIVTTPSAGIHYVESRADFFFYMSAAAGYSLDEVTVSTDRGNEVQLEPTDDGRIKVTIKRVNATITIRIEGVRHGVDNALVPESKVWGSTGVVYFSLPAATDVSVYTLTGTLYERRRLPAGDSRLPMPAGVYLIRLSEGGVYKVIVKN